MGDITSNLVAQFSLDGNLNDSSGNGNNLTDSGTVTFAAGKINQCGVFNGTSYGYVNSSLLGNSPANWTLACWVKGAAQSDKRIVAFGRSTVNTPILALQTGATNTVKLRFFIRSDENASYLLESTADVFDSSWHHVAITATASLVSIYVDGQASGTVGLSGAPTLTLDRSAVGCLLRGTAGSQFTGSIDEARIYSRCLSADDVATLFAWTTNAASSLLLRRRRFLMGAA